MGKLEELGRELAKIHMVLKVGGAVAEELMDELAGAGKSIGLNPEKRAEGYAFTPSRGAAAAGLPHLRVARIDDMIAVWVRSPYSLDEEKCRFMGMGVEDYYRRLVDGAMKIAEVLKKYSEKGGYLHVSLP